MRYIVSCMVATLFLTVGCEKKMERSKTVPDIATLPMVQVSLDDLTAFEAASANWQIVGKVYSDYSIEQDIKFEEGTGVLMNQIKDSGNENIFSTWDHGDIELELEFMMPAGSNSGVYFQGRYEIQLFDSWKIEVPTHADCGGIYQRWDDYAPDSLHGFEGHAPRLNASLAPGLWQHLYVKFTAPRFDEQGVKIENARFDKVILNGQTIHENVSLTGPTRASMTDNEAAQGPLMLQGDHGNVAFRNISYKRYFHQKLDLSALKYQFFETEMSAALPNFDSLDYQSEGTTDSFNIESIATREDFFGIRFLGTINAPKNGDYVFHTISDDGSKLYIDDQLVVDNDFNHGMERKSGLLTLGKGSHDLKVDYYNNRWGKGLIVMYEGPEIIYQPLNSRAPKTNNEDRQELLVEIGETPEMVRGFVNYAGEVRTHVISAGNPGGVHYSLDLRTGVLLKCWRGAFADVSNMWVNRGHSQLVIPQAVAVELSDVPILAMLPSVSEPNTPNMPQLKSEGYLLDDAGRPEFHYTLGKARAVESYSVSDNQERLIRDIDIEPNGEKDLFTRLAVASYIDYLSNGMYNIGGRYYLKLTDSNKEPVIRESDGRQELSIQLDGPTHIKYSLTW